MDFDRTTENQFAALAEYWISQAQSKISWVWMFIGAFMVLPTFFSVLNTSSPTKIRTEAVVLKVRPYQRSNSPRLRVKFEYTTERGRRIVRTRRVRVKSTDVLSIGDRITVSYRKGRPRRVRIVSLRPPPPIVTPTQPQGTNNNLYWYVLIGLVTLPAIGFGIHLIVREGTAAAVRQKSSHSQRNQVPSRSPFALNQVAKRPRRYDTPMPKQRPRKKSKVVQRAGWFS